VNTAALLTWYGAVARDLPWRRVRDPYAILVSEVMLQQTQAARVVPFFEAWMARFPDPATLAAAPVEDVLRAWSGLGYNRRALALRRAAAIVARDGWPDGAAGLRRLPGVGPYTAAAVASFAWDEPVAVVDTNVRRVIERWDGRERGPAGLAARAQELLADGHAATFNQATMELGATVCRPRRPDCPACPVAEGCASRGHATSPPLRSGDAARERFEDTDRWARGRVVAALLEARPLPELEPGRAERVFAGLVRDGLVVRQPGGALELPSG
jgi:A/G-specific adenine glycosylase